MELFKLSIVFISVIACVAAKSKYSADWESLDKRPLPEWYDKAKVGIFVHWGIFSVPSYESEWFWWLWKGDTKRRPNVPQYMRAQYAPTFTYSEFVHDFRAEFFQPIKWADLFAVSGSNYVVLTAKHHEGFCNWPSSTSWQWNAFDVGPRRDLVGELADAIRTRTGMHFGLYHSLFEWFNPLYLKDKENNFTTQEYIKKKMAPELIDLIHRYKPDILWSDGDNGPDVYWNSTEFLAWLYNESPVKNTVVTNDRWGDGCMCQHGGFYTCQDHYHPGRLIEHKWENCLTLDRKSWGFRREAELSDFMSPEELVYELVTTVAFGGNILLNVGPTAWGTISPIYEERLKQLGAWLRINGEAIYNTKPWKTQNETLSIWYTSKTPQTQLNDGLSTTFNQIKKEPRNMSESGTASHQEKDSSKLGVADSMIRNLVEVTYNVRRSNRYGVAESKIYAILTRWNDKSSIWPPSHVYLSHIRASSGVSKFYLLTDSSSASIELQFEPEPFGNPGVNVTLPMNTALSMAEPLRWGCVIKMFMVV